MGDADDADDDLIDAEAEALAETDARPQGRKRRPPDSPTPSAAAPLGIPCPGCRCCYHETIATRRGDRHIYRRRQCRHCGKRFTTFERY